MFFGHNLSRSTNTVLLSDGVAAGTGDTQTSGVLDMAGDLGVQVTVVLGTVVSTGTGLIKAQMSADNGVADPFTDIAGSGQSFTSANSGQAFVLDLYRPQKEYIQVQVIRATANITIQSIVAQTYHLGVAPEAPGAGVGGVTWLSNPGPGAA